MMLCTVERSWTRHRESQRCITDGYLWRIKYDNPDDENDFANYDAEDMKRWAIDYEDGVIAGKCQSSVDAGGSVPIELQHVDGSGDDGGVDGNSLRDGSDDDGEQQFITTGIGETWPDMYFQWSG